MSSHKGLGFVYVTSGFVLLFTAAMQADQIDIVMETLKTAVASMRTPVVGAIAEETHDPFLVLVSCILSLRTRDQTTATASARLFRIADTPKKILTLTAEQIADTIHPVSFYRNKASSILAIAQILEEKFSSKVPDDLETLLTLPGVGRKTANLVVSVGFGLPAICVDIHVHRISNRLGYITTKQPDESERVLRKNLPERYWISYNDILVPFGQHICTPISPFCSRCPVTSYCERRGVQKHR